MKKFLIVLTVLCSVSWGIASPMTENADYQTLRAGQNTVERLRTIKNQDFLLSNIIYPKQKRNVKVLTFINSSLTNFSPDPNYLQNNPGYAQAMKALFSYVEQAWQDWREAANAWLPQKYQLPVLKFSLVDAYKTDQSRQPRWNENTLNISVETTAGKEGFYLSGAQDPARGAGISMYTTQGGGYGRILFFMEQEWMDWFNSLNQSAQEQQKAAENYKKAVSAQMAGETFDAAAAEKGYRMNLSADAQKFIQVLSKSAPETWHQQGPWAFYNRQIFAHEMGHLFGLVHVNEEADSIMAPSMEGNLKVVLPSSADGLRLATLVCWYHNQRAKKTVCTPLTQQNQSQQRQQAVKNAMLELQKMQLVSNTVPAAPAPEIPAAIPQMDIAGHTPAPAQKPALASAKSAMKFTPPAALPQPQVKPLEAQTQQAFSLPQGSHYRPSIQKTSYAGLQNARPAAMQVQGYTPAAYKAPASRSVQPARSAASAQNTAGRAAAQRGQKQKPICFICGKEIEGNDYYSFTESRHVHKHSLCAYRAFARYHKTDNESLARYEDFYFFRVPQDVVQAKEDMRNLGLSFLDIRRYAAKDAYAARQAQKELTASDKARSQRAQKDQKCRFYVRVTDKDVQHFVKENQTVLSALRQKAKASKALSKKEALINRQYQQLTANYKLTQYCEGTGK